MTQETQLQALIKNSELLQKNMAELTKAFNNNMAVITKLITGLSPTQAAAAANGDPLTALEQALTIAVATLAAQGVHVIPRQWLAVVARTRPSSSTYRAALASLLKRRILVALTSRRGQGSVRATDTLAAAADAPIDWSELMHRFANVVKRQEADIVYQLLIAANDGVPSLDRKTLAEKLGLSAESSTFQTRLAKLQGDGFIEYGPDSTVRANIRWFSGVGETK